MLGCVSAGMKTGAIFVDDSDLNCATGEAFGWTKVALLIEQ